MHESKNTIDYEYIDNSHDYKWYSRLAEWFVLMFWVYLCVEAIFTNYIWNIVVERKAFWTRLSPVHIFPSDMLMYGPIFLISIFVMFRGRRYGYKTTRGIWMVVILLVLGAFQAVHGLWAGSTGKLWLSEYKQYMLVSVFMPFFCVLASSMRMDKLAKRFCAVGAVLAIYNGVMGVLSWLQILSYGSLFQPFHSGEYILILMYVFVLIRSIITGKASKFMLACLAFGIVLPLHKPALVMFVFSHFAVFTLMWRFGRRLGFVVSLRSVKMVFIIMLLLVLILGWAFTLGKDGGESAAKRFLAYRFLKVGQAGPIDITSGRLGAYKWAVLTWLKHPLFGTGFGIWMPVYGAEKFYENIPVHNSALSLLYQTGIVGFITYLLIFLTWLRRVYLFFKTCPDITEQWPLLGMFAWMMSVVCLDMIGRTLGIVQIGFMFWICAAFLSNAEAQHYMALLNGGYEIQREYDEE